MSDAPDSLILVYLRRLETKMDQLGHDQLALHQTVSTNLQYNQRLGTRLNELRDDLEIALRAEVMGASLGWRRQLEGRIDAIEVEMRDHAPRPS